MPLNFKGESPLPAFLRRPVEATYTLTDAAQPITPKVIPTYSIAIRFVPDLFFVAIGRISGRVRSRLAVKKAALRMELFGFPRNGKNYLTFIKLHLVQSVCECGISETDFAHSLGYG